MTQQQSDLTYLLRLYHDFGVTMAVSDIPMDHFSYNSLPKPKPSIRENLMNSRLVIPVEGEDVPAKKKLINSESLSLAKSCQSLADLRQALLDFEGCALKKTATNLVFADGNPSAKIMVVGEAPGADEDRQGLPFVGLSGQLLDRFFATIGLNRQENLYISNIVPWRPPGNRQPTTQEISLCQPFIQRHIELINPHILILVGGVAAKTILHSSEGIMKLRGRWHSWHSEALDNPIKTIATFHPAYLLRSPGQKAQVWKDLILIKHELEKK